MMVSEAETGSSVVSSCWLLFLWCLFSINRAECVRTQGTWCSVLFSINISLPHLTPSPLATHISCSAYTLDNTRNDLSPAMGEGQGLPDTL